MLKLTFKAHKKTAKTFPIYKNDNRILSKKIKERLSKRARERYQNLSGEEKTKSTNMFVSDIEIFLKKKKKRSVNMVVSDIGAEKCTMFQHFLVLIRMDLDKANDLPFEKVH